MKSYKELLNSLEDDNSLRLLSAEETQKLRKTMMDAYQELAKCCERHNLTVMLIGGSALGAVRHKGFIPWDDDLDVAMPREDFEKLKGIFERELGEKYYLSSPNYKGHSKGRFPMMMVRDTLLTDLGESPDDENARIKVDIFLIDNIPNNKMHRLLKGLTCTVLMFVASYVYSYEHRDAQTERFMCKTKEGEKEYKRRMRLGKLFSFKGTQWWYDSVDKAFQYKKETELLGIPSGRGHYFGEILPREAFLPASEGVFEGLSVKLPGKPQVYLNNLYGANYMQLPPEEKRERHMITEIRFREDD